MSQDDLTIDELARLAGSNVRNVRLYQERGLLPRPTKQGRTARYGPAHLERIRLIRSLLSRGYSLGAIRELQDAWEGQGLDGLCAILGFKEIPTPVNVEEPREFSIEVLNEAFPTAGPKDIDYAIEIGLLERVGDRFLTRSPALFDATRQLVADGFSLADVLDAAGSLRVSMDHLAQQFVALFASHFFGRGSRGSSAEPLSIGDTMQRYLTLASGVVQSEFARAMQGAVEFPERSTEESRG